MWAHTSRRAAEKPTQTILRAGHIWRILHALDFHIRAGWPVGCYYSAVENKPKFVKRASYVAACAEMVWKACSNVKTFSSSSSSIWLWLWNRPKWKISCGFREISQRFLLWKCLFICVLFVYLFFCTNIFSNLILCAIQKSDFLLQTANTLRYKNRTDNSCFKMILWDDLTFNTRFFFLCVRLHTIMRGSLSL